MTVSNETYRHDYSGNGATVLFAISFYFLVDAHIKAILYNDVTDVETELTLTTHYTLTGEGNENGGELTMLVAPTSDETLTILRNVDLKQETDYVEGSSFPADDHENALDKLTMIVQQIQEELDRSLKAAESQTGGWTLPVAIEGYFLRWVSDQLESYNIADLSLYSVSAFVETLLDDADAAEFFTTLGVTAFIQTLFDDADAATARATLGVTEPGTFVDNANSNLCYSAALCDGYRHTSNEYRGNTAYAKSNLRCPGPCYRRSRSQRCFL